MVTKGPLESSAASRRSQALARSGLEQDAVPEAELPSGQVPTQLLAPPSGREPTRLLPLEPPPRQRPPAGKPRSVLLPIAVAVSVLAVVVLGVAAVLVWRWRGP